MDCIVHGVVKSRKQLSTHSLLDLKYSPAPDPSPQTCHLARGSDFCLQGRASGQHLYCQKVVKEVGFEG